MHSAANSGPPAAAVWRSTPLRLALVAVPAWFTIADLVFATPWREKLVVGPVLALSLASPALGLLLVAAVAPFGHLYSTVAGIEPFRGSEAAVLAFIAGWLLRRREDRAGPRVAALVGWGVAACVAASIAAQAWQIGHHDHELRHTLDSIFHLYYLTGDNGRIGLLDAARLLEGLALSVAVVSLFRQRPALAIRLPLVLVASGAVAAALSVLVWQGVGPAEALARYEHIGYRVSAHVTDVNAAGSYFGMILCLALGMAWHARGGNRAAVGCWITAAVVITLGLWLSRSRAASAAVSILLPPAIAWPIVARWRPTRRVALLTAVAIVAIGAGAVRARLLERGPAPGAELRKQFTATSLRMVKSRPWLGVGAGQYYQTSSLFLSPQLAFSYGFENAHNYYLQIAAELGLVGGLLFAGWLCVGFARAGRALGRMPRDPRLLGLTAGTAAFAGTALAGHPFLIDEVAFPFWLVFGLVLALASSTLLDARPPESAMSAAPRPLLSVPFATALFGTGVLVATLVSARNGPIEPPASQAVDGLYPWETAEDGSRFRWTGPYGSLFVPSTTTRVSVPLRLPVQVPSLVPMGVAVVASGVWRGRMFVGKDWAIFDVVLPDVQPPLRFKRVDLHADRSWQPGLYIAGSSDMRLLGVQVGECQLFEGR